ncbi:MAG: TerC family protein [Blastocatellia bacterium]
MNVMLFPFGDYWWLYVGFVLFVLLMLVIDLGIFQRHAHAVSFREAAIWSGVWVALSLIFNFALYHYALWQLPRDPRLAALPGFDAAAAAWQVALEFLTGYVVEKSLSVDNIFIFVVIFGYFHIPARYQHRVLFYGILGALVFRGIFIAIGSALMQYHWVLVIFGVFLIITGARMMWAGSERFEPERNPALRLFRRLVPVTEELHDDHFLVRLNDVWHATPLLVALLVLEMTDIIFAIDSVPAIFALTDEPLIVFTSNIFAILGLRAMYFMLAGAVEKFYLLKYGLAVVLIFVGLKMVWLNDWYGGKFPISLSLGFIVTIIGAAIILSLLFPKRQGAATAPPRERPT